MPKNLAVLDMISLCFFPIINQYVAFLLSLCFNLFIYKMETLLIAASQDRHFEFVIYSALIFLHSKTQLMLILVLVSIKIWFTYLVLDLICKIMKEASKINRVFSVSDWPWRILYPSQWIFFSYNRFVKDRFFPSHDIKCIPCTLTYSIVLHTF